MSDGILLGWLPLSVLAWAVQMAVFHGIGFAFEWCDRTGRLSGAKVRNVGRLSYRAALPRVLVNQVFVLLPAMMLVQWAGLAFTGVTHLPAWQFLLDLVLMGISHDIVQYIAHRHILHRPGIGRMFGHGIHHGTGASQAITACYMSAADFFLEIVLPYLVPLVLIGGGGGDVFFHCFVAGAGAFGGLYEHSGYDFAVPLRKTRFFAQRPRLGGWIAAAITSHAHGEHHRRSNVSFSDGFGSPGICDTLFGTRWDKADHGSRPRVPAQSMF
ncbi:sterol desaturase family protein [Methyloferula stellata]|uniref:sterol desaturase family protein n=1 Tax=Methyloferula stellata TaxID=876270 RepID=UPI0003631953|nr:sterol desaturase family protein [Methyloferula stellata]